MAYEKNDDLEMHYLNVDADIPQEQFGVPTGQYVAWLIRRGWASDELNARADDLSAGRTTGSQILWTACDGKLTADDLSDAGKAFTDAYFEKSYFKDYGALFDLDRSEPAALYQPPDTPENAARVARMLDARVRAVGVTPRMPPTDAVHRHLLDCALEHLGRDGFKPSDELRWSERFRCNALTKRFAGGEHTLTLGTYLDRARGHQGFFADLASVQEKLAAALKEAFAPAERAAMSAADERYLPLRLPMHAWVGSHPLLTEVQEGIDRFDWLGRRRVVVTIADPDEIPHAAAVLMQLLDRDLLPKLPDLQSPAGMAPLKCRSPLKSAPANFSEYDRAILVVAAAARVPNLVELCDEMAQWVTEGKPRLSLHDRLMMQFIERVRAAATGTR